MTSSSAAGSGPRPNSNLRSRAPQTEERQAILSSPPAWLAGLILVAGFIARITPASRLFLNPDEALHNLLASQPSVTQAYAAALTNAHPPLLILVLYFWRWLGQSELWLRLPSVLAGTAACWFFYRWLRSLTDCFTALVGLLLMSFAPSLVLLSAEVRQYALLLLFITACLYYSQRALQKNSPLLMAVFSLSLYGAILTHYSALMFAFAIGVSMVVLLYPYRQRNLVVTWGLGQLGGIAIAAYFLLTHLPRLRESGMVRTDLESYLSRSIYHPGERNPVVFITEQTLRVFTYLFSHGLIGSLMLIFFLAGMGVLVKRRTRLVSEPPVRGPSSHQLAILLGVPFLVNWAVALAGLYPLGATRHSSFLAPFAIAGASLGIVQLPDQKWIKTVAIVVALAVCNLFPAPPPPIRAKNQSAALMHDAVSHLHASVPAGSAFLTDYESGLLLGYYLCGHGVVQVFPPQPPPPQQPPPQPPLTSAACGDYQVVSTSFRDWKFTAATFPDEFAKASKAVSPGTEIWLFYAGWINDSAPALQRELGQSGCPALQKFGENILICRLQPGG